MERKNILTPETKYSMLRLKRELRDQVSGLLSTVLCKNQAIQGKSLFSTLYTSIPHT